MLRLHEDLVKSVLLQDRTYRELTLEIHRSKNKHFQGRIKELKRNHAAGRARPAEVEFIELVDRWRSRVFYLTSNHLEVCFKKSPSLNNK
jgi:hypothetical protein